MKIFLKLLLKAGITLGIMFIGYKYMLTGGGGFQIPGISNATHKAQKGITELGNAVVDKEVTVYQWVDAHGTTHYGGTPPTGQGKYEKKEIHTSTNLVSAFKLPQEEEEEIPEQRSRFSRVGSVYSPEGVKKVMDDAKDISRKLEERSAAQQKILDQL